MSGNSDSTEVIETFKLGSSELNEQVIDSVRKWGNMLWGSQNGLKWTLLLAFNGGFYQSHLKHYYKKSKKARRHRTQFINNMLAVQITENKFTDEGLDQMAQWLRNRRDENVKRAPPDDLNISIGDPLKSGDNIMHIVDNLVSTQSGAKNAEIDFSDRNPPNNHKWIFLTPLGEEFLQAICGNDCSLCTPARVADTVGVFLKSLPKVTRMGGSPYVPSISFFEDKSIVTLDEDDFDRQIDAYSAIKSKVNQTVRDSEQIDIIAPYRAMGLDSALSNSDAKIRFIMDSNLHGNYQEKKKEREWVNRALLNSDNAEPMLNTDHPKMVDLNLLETRSPYLFIQTSASEQSGDILIYGIGDRDTDEKQILVQADETADTNKSLYNWGESLFKEIYEAANKM